MTSKVKKEIVLPLHELLEDALALPWNYYLYVADKRHLTTDMRSAVVDPRDADADDPETDPEFARTNGLQYLLGMADVRSVIENATTQLGRAPNIDETLQALRFYVDRDAFIRFRKVTAT